MFNDIHEASGRRLRLLHRLNGVEGCSKSSEGVHHTAHNHDEIAAHQTLPIASLVPTHVHVIADGATGGGHVEVGSHAVLDAAGERVDTTRLEELHVEASSLIVDEIRVGEVYEGNGEVVGEGHRAQPSTRLVERAEKRHAAAADDRRVVASELRFCVQRHHGLDSAKTLIRYAVCLFVVLHQRLDPVPHRIRVLQSGIHHDWGSDQRQQRQLPTLRINRTIKKHMPKAKNGAS